MLGAYRPWVLALLLSVSLYAGLVVANLIYAAQARTTYILEGNPGELLYVSAFSGFADEWDLYDGLQSAKIVEEQLELRVSSAQTATWSVARHHFRDFDMRVTVRAQAGPVDNAMGVVFHAQDQDEGACDLPAVILCGIEDLLPLAGAAFRQVQDRAETESRLIFLISSDGYYSLRRAAAGQTKVLSAWIPTPQINQGLGSTNTIRVVASDSSYRFFINGAAVALCLPSDAGAASTYTGGECVDGAMHDSFPLEDLRSGKLGLIAQSTATGGGGLVVRFDNLLVFSPTPPNAEDVQL